MVIYPTVKRDVSPQRREGEGVGPTLQDWRGSVVSAHKREPKKSHWHYPSDHKPLGASGDKNVSLHRLNVYIRIYIDQQEAELYSTVHW